MELEKLYVSLVVDAAGYARGLQQATSDGVSWARDWGSRVSNALSAAFKVGLVAVTAVMAALMLALGSSTSLAADFQTQITTLGLAASGSSVGLDQLHDAALAVGSDTALVGVSATGAADAMTNLYKAGLTTGEIFGDLQGYLAGTAELGGALRASIDLAAASELDMVQASELAAVSLATFGGHLKTEAERAEFVNAAMNNMVQAADASVASVSGLADALVNVGPTAAAFGFSLQETNTALAILSTRGIEGSEAGTALKSMMTNLMRQTDDVTGTLADLNVELYDADGAMRQLPDILGQLEAGMAGLTEEQRNVAIQTLAGTYGMNAMNALLGEGTEGWEAMTEAIAGASTMQEIAEAQANTFQGRMEALRGTVESVQIGIGEALLPVLSLLASAAADFVSDNGPALVSLFASLVDFVTNQLVPGLQRLVSVFTEGGFDALFAVFEDGSSVIGAFLEQLGVGEETANDMGVALGDLYENSQQFLEAVIEFLTPIATAVAGFVSWQDVLVALGVVLAVVILPILYSAIAAVISFAAPIVALIGVVALLRTAWENDFAGIRDFVAGVWLAIQTAWEGFKALFEGDFAGFAANLVVAWEVGWNALLVFLVNILGQIQTVVLSGLAALGTAIGVDLVTPFTNAQTAVGMAISTIATTITAGFGGIVAWFTENWLMIQAVVLTAWAVIQATVAAALAVIQPAIQAFVTNAQEGLRSFEPTLQKLGELWTALQPIIGVAVAAIGAIILALVGVVVGMVNGVANAIAPLLTTFSFVLNGIITALTGVAQFITGFVQLVIGLFQGNSEAVEAAWQKMNDGLTNIVLGLVEAIVGAFVGLLATLHALVEGMVEGIVGFFTNLYDELVGNSIVPDLVNDILEWFASLAADAVQWVVDMVTGIVTTFTSTDWAALGQGIIDGIAGAIVGGAAAIAGAAQAAAQSALDAAKSLLGIDSPSKVAADEIGKPFVEGVSAGMWDTMPVIEETVRDVILDPIEWLGEEVEEKGKGIGEEAIARCGDGLTEGRPRLEEVIEDVIEAIDPAAIGSNFGTLLAEGIVAEAETVGAAVRSLLDVAGEISSIGGAFASMFEARTLDPLRAQAGAIEGRIGDLQGRIADELGRSDFFSGGGTYAELLRLSRGELEGGTLRSVMAARELLNLYQEQGEVAAEIRQEQERIAELQRQQADLQFLEQQMRLLDLISEHGLDAGAILGGIELGLNASLPDLLAAMSAAMQAIIGQAEEDLGISSPSRVAADLIGRPLAQGIAQGMRLAAGSVDTAMDEVLGRALAGRGQEAALAGAAVGDDNRADNRRYETTVQLLPGQDPLRALRAARHLDKLGRAG